MYSSPGSTRYHAYKAVYAHTTITSGPIGGEHWADPDPQFDFAASQSGATFTCRVGTHAWASCPTPFISSHLADGAHTISVSGLGRRRARGAGH
jgi:hypothetical protein